MTISIQNSPKKNLDQSSFHSMSQFAVTPWWNSDENMSTQSLSNNLSLKMETPAQGCHVAKQLCFQTQDQDSSSTQSAGQSHHEVAAMGGTNSQDQCISPESGQDDSYGKHAEAQMKPVIFLHNPDHMFHPSQIDYGHQMTHFSYPYAGPHFGGLVTTAYGPQAIIQPQMMGIAPSRVPLPLDLAEDGPIYVNAKQYNGILRRRQSRAKLEAQNKLVKVRKPYLHESRHIHALNRVRGTGGRFLSTKKERHAPTHPTNDSNYDSNYVSGSVHPQRGGDMLEFEVGQSERNNSVSTSMTSCADITSYSTNDVIFRQPDGRFSGISSRTMQGGGMCNGTQHRAPVVR